MLAATTDAPTPEKDELLRMEEEFAAMKAKIEAQTQSVRDAAIDNGGVLQAMRTDVSSTTISERHAPIRIKDSVLVSKKLSEKLKLTEFKDAVRTTRIMNARNYMEITEGVKNAGKRNPSPHPRGTRDGRTSAERV